MVNNNLLNIEKQEIRVNTIFDYIKINIASPEQIKLWSYGEVTKPETVNYRTFKPEKDGLFCSKIFGPIKDYECLCGKYKRLKYRGIICERCGVEVTQTKVRRERMGHIELVSPVVHIWYLKSLPSKISIILNMSLKDIENILYFETYIVSKSDYNFLTIKELLTEEQVLGYKKKYKNFKVMTGVEAIEFLLFSINLRQEIQNVRQNIILTNSLTKLKKLNYRLRLLELFKFSGNKPEWMIIKILPVLPPDLRPLVPLDGGRFAASDLNDLYRRIISRNNRLKKLLELSAPDIIIRNEKRMLQEAVDSLLDNGRGGKSILDNNKRPLKSLSSMIRGKQGRFRQNLLGKRVDYSGRSVIVVGPTLRLFQCGLPNRMALELFKPFIYSKLGQLDHAVTIQAAKKIVEEKRNVVWNILYKVTKEFPVLLNRAPTLHRLGIQAFEPILIHGKAIQLHPLVCSSFNADFDGDQMAVHIPLTLEAQLESRVLMMSTSNLLSPANSLPIIIPTQDIVLGLYYLSLSSLNSPLLHSNNYNVYIDPFYIIKAYYAGYLFLHSFVYVRLKQKILLFNGKYHIDIRYNLTTVGRLFLFIILPVGLPFCLVNCVLKKHYVMNIILECYRRLGSGVTSKFLDKLMYLGYYYSTTAGISICLEDMVIPSSKKYNLQVTLFKVKEINNQYLCGYITLAERYNKIIDIWVETNSIVSATMFEGISSVSNINNNIFNSIYIMADSGSRGSSTQIQQLAGMRGLMTKSDGSILETPITSNFREGLSVLEYFVSTHGARKGLADTALKTSNSGYLTRRLVDVAQDLIITEKDCQTSKGLEFLDFMFLKNRNKQYLFNKLFGRVLSEDLFFGNSLVFPVIKGSIIDQYIINKIIKYGITKIVIRSAITCDSQIGICSLCYGIDLSRRCLVNIGETVGVIAAQSIGEPGTQLTMRTFHIGGILAKVHNARNICSNLPGIVYYDNLQFIQNLHKEKIVVSLCSELRIYDFNFHVIEKYVVPYGSYIFIDNWSYVKAYDVICAWDPYFVPVISKSKGYVFFSGFIEGFTTKTTIDKVTNLLSLTIISEYCDQSNINFKPMIIIRNTNNISSSHNQCSINNNVHNTSSYSLPIGAVVHVQQFSFVHTGSILAKIPQVNIKSKDITGGLTRVVDLFEVRKLKNSVILATISGIIKFGQETKEKQKIIIINNHKNIIVEILVPKWRQLNIYAGKIVNQGDIISDGPEDLHQILNICGIQKLTDYITDEIQTVYYIQGVQINSKHIEVILRQMLKIAVIIDRGDSNFLNGEKTRLLRILMINKNLKKKKKKLIVFSLLLLGITKASLATDSFLSAASFQETTKVLTDAAIAGKIDLLQGLKENVLLGRLIPSGTGFFFYKNETK